MSGQTREMPRSTPWLLELPQRNNHCRRPYAEGRQYRCSANPSTGDLNIIQQGHLGQERCLLRARISVSLPGLTKDVINLVKECDPCQTHHRQRQKQPILQPEPPNYPWKRLNSDLFQFKGHQYLLISDQHSKFPVIKKLTSTTSQAIVTHLKLKHLCRTRHPCPIQTTIHCKGAPRFYWMLWWRAPHNLHTLSTGKRVLCTRGTDSGKHTEEMWRRRWRSLPRTAIIQSNTYRPSPEITSRTANQ